MQWRDKGRLAQSEQVRCAHLNAGVVSLARNITAALGWAEAKTEEHRVKQ